MCQEGKFIRIDIRNKTSEVGTVKSFLVIKKNVGRF